MKSDTHIQAETKGIIGGDFSNLVSEIMPSGHIIDKLLSLVETVVAYAFGIYIGLVVGSLMARYIGGVHADDIRHTIDFLDLEQLRQWQDMPSNFARTGALIGALLGTAATSIVQVKFFNLEVASLYEHGVTDPKDIARILGRSARKTKKAITNLAGKRIIDCRPNK
ncbi:MAG: hypothetical protein JXN61_11585 [Sedimentisphaerales bacterium]|nr:hypothetical protein [Sedimentisphaerales bacterium]